MRLSYAYEICLDLAHLIKALQVSYDISSLAERRPGMATDAALE